MRFFIINMILAFNVLTCFNNWLSHPNDDLLGILTLLPDKDKQAVQALAYVTNLCLIITCLFLSCIYRGENEFCNQEIAGYN